MTPVVVRPVEIEGFEFVEPIATGGFGDVHKYRQRRLDGLFAVKVLKGHVFDRSAFDEEARAMASLSWHPYVVKVWDVDIAPDDRPYIVMEFCPGDTLAARARGGRLDLPLVLRWSVQVGSAVESVHRAGILHGDIKPANVLTMGGDPRLTDFGISVRAGDQVNSGYSPPYAAPELFDDDSRMTVASEVWALAATVHTLLTGRPPFAAAAGDERGPVALARRIRTARRPRTGRPDVPEALEALLDRAMTKDPAGRPGSVLEFVEALCDVQRGLGWQPTHIALPGAEDDRTTPKLVIDLDDVTRLRPRSVVLDDAVALADEQPQPPAPPPAPDGRPVYEFLPVDVPRPGGVPDAGPVAVAVADAVDDTGTPGPGGSSAVTGEDLSATVRRPAPADTEPATASAGLDVRPPYYRRDRVLGLVAAVLVLGGAGTVLALNWPDTGEERAPVSARDVAADGDAVLGLPAEPTNLTGTLAADGTATFSWDAVSRLGDTGGYQWRPQWFGNWTTTTETRVTLPADQVQAGTRCLVLRALNAAGQVSLERLACAS